jgi:hypothetical protein
MKYLKSINEVKASLNEDWKRVTVKDVYSRLPNEWKNWYGKHDIKDDEPFHNARAQMAVAFNDVFKNANPSKTDPAEFYFTGVFGNMLTSIDYEKLGGNDSIIKFTYVTIDDHEMLTKMYDASIKRIHKTFNRGVIGSMLLYNNSLDNSVDANIIEMKYKDSDDGKDLLKKLPGFIKDVKKILKGLSEGLNEAKKFKGDFDKFMQELENLGHEYSFTIGKKDASFEFNMENDDTVTFELTSKGIKYGQNGENYNLIKKGEKAEDVWSDIEDLVDEWSSDRYM